MPPFKDSFQDRVGQAAEAKQKALDRLKAKPPVDPEVAAARQEAARQREAKAEEKRAAKAEKAKAAEEAKAADAAARAAASAPPPTEAERKAARDAKYAARKSRK